ncbi:hypothetical protein L1887_18873 [Cichorium endivia]|nr:hypothetical protein L1887_18873 [Cichorium endivia]
MTNKALEVLVELVAGVFSSLCNQRCSLSEETLRSEKVKAMEACDSLTMELEKLKLIPFSDNEDRCILYPKATGAAKPIGKPKPARIKKPLVFYAGKAPRAIGKWISCYIGKRKHIYIWVTGSGLQTPSLAVAIFSRPAQGDSTNSSKNSR